MFQRRGEWIARADRKGSDGYVGALVLPTRWGQIVVSAEVPQGAVRALRATIAELHRELHRTMPPELRELAEGVEGDELGAVDEWVSGEIVGCLPAVGDEVGLPFLGALVPGLVQAGSSLLGGLFGRRQQAPPAPRPPQQPPQQQQQQSPAQSGPVPSAVVAMPAPALPGLAGVLASGQIPPALAAQLLGGAGTLAQAQQLAAGPSARAVFGEMQAPVAGLVRTALRSLDATAARDLGDPAARDALARARETTEARVANALRMVDSLLGV